jgi:hypothetical protein
MMRCQAKDSSGKRCRRESNTLVDYHGDVELYGWGGPEPGWVSVYLCDKHRKPARRPSNRRTPPEGRE